MGKFTFEHGLYISEVPKQLHNIPELLYSQLHLCTNKEGLHGHWFSVSVQILNCIFVPNKGGLHVWALVLCISPDSKLHLCTQQGRPSYMGTVLCISPNSG